MGKYTYGFNNLCGVVYKTGNVVFTPDGNTLLSPVGNRVSCFDLVGCVPSVCDPFLRVVYPPAASFSVHSLSHSMCRHSSFTLDFETRSDISRIAISPDGRLLLAVDVGEWSAGASHAWVHGCRLCHA